MKKIEKFEQFGLEAQVEYDHADIRLLKHGSFVRCAVTGKPILLDDLRYWSVERQEAYATTDAVLKRIGTTAR